MRKAIFPILSIILLTLIALLLLHRFSHEPEEVINSALSGGDTTVFDSSSDAFARPLANLSTEKMRDFSFGNKMFNTNWVEAPASVTSLDGLGPTFNRISCSGCHFKDGRGRPPLDQNEPMNSMLLRLSIPGKAEDGGPMPHPNYGNQLNDKAIHNVPAEGQTVISYEEIEGKYADGTSYNLRKPKYDFINLAFGELGKNIMFSPRTAPQVAGLGLLEAIPEETILSFADPEDKNQDGISGRPNYILDADSNKKIIGRFGWKANVSSIKKQNAGAVLGDIGITTSLNKNENCPDTQIACKKAINGGSPEMSDEQLKKLVFYSQTLAVPARRNINEKEVKLGAKLFTQANCSSCHKPKMKTGEHEIPELRNQEIQPFTDLLLHDMGEELADSRPDYEANGREWRTAPLWGIGLVKTVNKHTFFLHDGRARNLEEAILWHGGEAEKSKEKFRNMSKKDRDALIKFLDSL